MSEDRFVIEEQVFDANLDPLWTMIGVIPVYVQVKDGQVNRVVADDGDVRDLSPDQVPQWAHDAMANTYMWPGWDLSF
jgi:hypothetical protein